ncbi:MAG TPA: hypothetical protein VN706_18080 [Gemmatimonadaceae bacterium]|nr:hypothetical protein [Gemmatimonadaceae bacterium]
MTFMTFVVPLTVAACSDGSGLSTGTLLSDTASVDGDFRETASVAPSPLRAAVDVTLLIMNRGTRPETLYSSESGSCDGGLIVRAWHHANGRNTLAWLSSAVPVVPCPGHPLPLVLAPNASVSLTREIGNAEILGDSLPSDTYILTASADLRSPTLPAQVTAASIFIGLEYIVPPGTVLDGTWSGGADGILLRLALRWTADSVNGTGTYVATPPYSNRCGGSTLRGSGTVKFTAARTEDRLVGHMAFDNGWTPPYSAVQTGRDLLDGHFMSVDVGPCPMPLGREIPAQ